MNTFSHVPPGFRFHPSDEELVDYYLRKKIASAKIDLDVIKDVDLYRIEPWDLQELCRLGSEEQNEWYFFSHKDKKYPTGTRTNRATKAGFWKATGRDKPIYARHSLVGMRKTLVFYQGRAPNGLRSDWIMHEYRIETNENATPQEEGWVVCRVFKKRTTTVQKMSDYVESPYDHHHQVSFMPQSYGSCHQQYSCKQELELQYYEDPFLQLPHLESPKVPQSDSNNNMLHSYVLDLTSRGSSSTLQSSTMNNLVYISNDDQAVDEVTDWRVLDKFVASQLSHEDDSKDTNYGSVAEHRNNVHVGELRRPEIGEGSYAASTSASSCQIDLWK